MPSRYASSALTFASVVHGQLPERELEQRMLSFLAGDADVLVSTTIIESGLDIPHANTLVVERADALGLAQLYQIRGRVGRSDVVAHAYLFYPDGEELTAEARARLAALADHTELGAGFQIAMRDLEIRGAGNLLGAEQSGHVAAVGFELYLELLDEAVAELAGSRRAAARPVRVDAQLDAYVPADYIESEAQKIDLHRRLALVESEDELRELRAGVEDRFGPPRAGRAPLRHPGGEVSRRPARGRLPRVSWGARDGWAARPRLGRVAGAPRPRGDGGLHERAERGVASSDPVRSGARTTRCYYRSPACRLGQAAFSAQSLCGSSPSSSPSSALASVLAACGGGDSENSAATTAAVSQKDVPADAVALVGDEPISKASFDALLERRAELQDAEA